MSNIHIAMEEQVLRAISDTDEPLRSVQHKNPRQLPKVIDGNILTWVKPDPALTFDYYTEHWRHNVLVGVEYQITGAERPILVSLQGVCTSAPSSEDEDNAP